MSKMLMFLFFLDECELAYKRIKGIEGKPCNFVILVNLNFAAICYIAVIATHCNHRCMSSGTVKTKNIFLLIKKVHSLIQFIKTI